jgi:hypothetical protein
MKAVNWIFGYIFINTAAFLLIFNIPGVGPIIPVGREINVSPLDISNTFNLTVFGALTVGGAVLGVIAVLLRQYVYAAGVLLIWVIGIIMPVVWWLIGGLPMMLSAILAPYDMTWLITTVVAFATVHLFFFLVEFAAGRQVT